MPWNWFELYFVSNDRSDKEENISLLQPKLKLKFSLR